MTGIANKNQLVPPIETVYGRPSVRGKLCPVALGHLLEDLSQSWVGILCKFSC